MLAVPDGGRGPAVGDGADEVGFDGGFDGQFDADLAAGFVDRATTEDAVGAAEIDVLKEAETGFCRLEGPGRFDLVAFDNDHLARLDLADELGPDDVEGAGF